MPGQTVSAGVCLESFVVATTDEAFVPQFVDRTEDDAQHTKVRASGGNRNGRALVCDARLPTSSAVWCPPSASHAASLPREERRNSATSRAEHPSRSSGFLLSFLRTGLSPFCRVGHFVSQTFLPAANAATVDQHAVHPASSGSRCRARPGTVGGPAIHRFCFHAMSRAVFFPPFFFIWRGRCTNWRAWRDSRCTGAPTTKRGVFRRRKRFPCCTRGGALQRVR